MKGRRVKRYQEGGLAAVGMPMVEEEEEFMGPPAVTSEQIVERTTNPAAGQSLTDLIFANKQSAIDRLRASRENLATRRDDQRKRMEQDKWLALAQAMLSPTKTGAFGENVGMAAGALRGESARRAEAEAAFEEQEMTLVGAEMAAESEMIDQLLKQSGYAAANRARSVHGSIQTMIHPADMGKRVEDQRIIFGAVMRDPNDPESEMRLRPLESEDGTMFEAASRLDPARANALIRAAERAEATTARSEDFINAAYTRKSSLHNIREANKILENAEVEIETSGIQAIKNRLANFIGVDIGDTTELTELQIRIAEDYMSKLQNLKGPASDKDLAEMKGISAGLGQNTDANYRILKDMEQIYSRAIVRGIREAWYGARESTSSAEKRQYMDSVADLWQAVDGFEFDPSAVFISTKEEFDKLPSGAKYYRVGQWGGPYGQKP